ncbi:MAG: M23 family metallopeptidase [Nannocystaceae bacterium]|nr:M23 family metallopeptidase [Nannocystaceae bacterium]
MTRASVVLLLAFTACRSPTAETAHPVEDPRRTQVSNQSQVDVTRADTMHRLLEAARTDSVAAVMKQASPRLAEELSPEGLQAALAELTANFGEPLGILEEQVFAEAESRWYSGVALHGQVSGGGVLTPVLYQFSLDGRGRLDTLLVREHWFIENLRHPAEAYLPVSRFHLPSRGTWYVLHGGRARATNYHHGNTHQRWAFDLIVKRDGRQRERGTDRHQNENYHAHGQDLLAPAAGTVTHVVDGVPENRPPERGRAGGNGLIIDHGFGEYSALWHAIPGSLEVEVGDRVETGQRVAKVGNSGRSTGPHIHWHVSYRVPGETTEVFGLPADMTDILVDNTWYEHKMPVRGQYIHAAQRPKLEIKPVADAPIVFLDL